MILDLVRTPRRYSLAIAWIALLLGGSTASRTAEPPTSSQPASIPPQAREFFEQKIRPILADHCFPCHGEKKQKGGLRLDSRAAMLTGGDSGPVLVPGAP